MKNLRKKLSAVAALALAAPVTVQAAVPTYVNTALANAQTTLTEYIEAAAPVLFAITMIIAAIFLIVRFMKRAAS